MQRLDCVLFVGIGLTLFLKNLINWILRDDNLKIEILGAGCGNCIRLFEHVKKAVLLSGREDIEIIKVENMMEIMKYKVMRTPALVINGEVKFVGRVPEVKEIRNLITD